MADEISRERMAEQARLATAVLDQGRSLDYWSLLFTGAALAAPLIGAGSADRWNLVAVVLAGLAQKFFALRVGMEREIFGSWALRWQQQGADPFLDLETMDESLTTLSLGQVFGAPAARPLAERVGGALRVFRRQVWAFAVQALLLAVALATA